MKTIKLFPIGIFALLFLNSCSKDDNNNIIIPPVNEPEVITTLTATLNPQGGGTAIILKSKDLDGDGPNAPVITVSGNLTAGTVYNGSLSILNETVSPAENVSEAILAEGVDHQFFFLGSPSTIGTAAYIAPFDTNGRPIGLNFTYTAGNAATGNLTIVLRHEPNKSAANVSNGDITNAEGETDIQATFPIIVD